MHPYSSVVAAKSFGFTLLELLVVMVLGAMAVGVVGGSAQSFMERAQYHQAVRDVAGHGLGHGLVNEGLGQPWMRWDNVR